MDGIMAFSTFILFPSLPILFLSLAKYYESDIKKRLIHSAFISGLITDSVAIIILFHSAKPHNTLNRILIFLIIIPVLIIKLLSYLVLKHGAAEYKQGHYLVLSLFSIDTAL